MSNEIVGIKVTSVDEMNGKCPRGGAGCGVCTSLTEPFCISEETEGPPGKDTTRMLKAGASRVLWLRCLKTHLKQGAQALLDRLGPCTVCVCESNSLRHVLRPGIFVIVKDKNAGGFKASADEVLEFADCVVLSDGRQFDLDLGRIALSNGRWALKEYATAIMLAGGDSGRMGRDKCMLPVGGLPMVERIFRQIAPHFEEVIISANDPDRFKFLNLPVIPDLKRGTGPLGGILSSLLTSSSDKNVVVACDIPDVNLPLLRRLLGMLDGFDAAIPRSNEGFLEPLFAAYSKSIIPAMRRQLDDGYRKISTVFDHAKIGYLDLPVGYDLKNLNTKRDYEEYIEQHDTS
ncbi:MAG: molybdenum cofactor guanylyltransferase [Candidatus Coatesbacteria bacterium]|nr:molybdenum cofactor guanylyltransferase [Candidatus Coatesbacteria bacterium]